MAKVFHKKPEECVNWSQETYRPIVKAHLKQGTGTQRATVADDWCQPPPADERGFPLSLSHPHVADRIPCPVADNNTLEKPFDLHNELILGIYRSPKHHGCKRRIFLVIPKTDSRPKKPAILCRAD